MNSAIEVQKFGRFGLWARRRRPYWWTGNSSGPEIGAKLLAVRSDLKMFFTSGYDGESLAERYGLKVETPILAKPFTMAQLDAAMTAVLAG